MTKRKRRSSYVEARKKALKVNGVIVLESLPKKYRGKLLKKRKYTREYKKRLKIRTFDPKIYLYKYYPWCYCNYEVRLVLQGWYNVKAAKKAYLRFYGKDALKYINFIKGKDALERGWKPSTKNTLYINGRWVKVRMKTFNSEVSAKLNSYSPEILPIKKEMDKVSSPIQKERILLEGVSCKNYGQKSSIRANKPKKTLRVQNVQKIEQQKKRTLYEE